MSKADARRRLLKGDSDLIAKALEARGFEVKKSDNRVEAWCVETGRYVCGFYWRPAVKAKGNIPVQPGCWRFDLALADCFSIKDLRSAMTEAKRVRRLVIKCRAAWKVFTTSRSDGRWMDYRSLVAALFLRQDVEEE